MLHCFDLIFFFPSAFCKLWKLLWVYRTLFSITPTGFQAVISFSEHSIELYGVVGIATFHPFPFLLHCLQIHFIWLPATFLLLPFPLTEMKSKCHFFKIIFLQQSLLCKLLDFQSKVNCHTWALSKFMCILFCFVSATLNSSPAGNKKRAHSSIYLSAFALKFWTTRLCRTATTRCMNGNESENEHRACRW